MPETPGPEPEFVKDMGLEPHELALELAKKEAKEPKRKTFEQILLEELKKEYSEHLAQASDEWVNEDYPEGSFMQALKQFYLEMKARGELPSIEDEKIFLQKVDQIHPNFDYNTDGSVKTIYFDLGTTRHKRPIPGLNLNFADLQNQRQLSDIYRETIEEIGTPHPKFAAGGLPPNPQSGEIDDPQAVSEEKQRLPRQYGFDYQRIFQRAAHKEPEGAEYYLEDILDKEEAELEYLVNVVKVYTERLKNRRREAIITGEPAGPLLEAVRVYEQELEQFQKQQNGLRKFHSERLPGI